jgi:HSP20 family protein
MAFSRSLVPFFLEASPRPRPRLLRGRISSLNPPMFQPSFSQLVQNPLFDDPFFLQPDLSLSMHQSLFGHAVGPAPPRPRFKLAEQPDAYTMAVELPGFAKENVKVDYANGQLTVSGKFEATTVEQKPAVEAEKDNSTTTSSTLTSASEGKATCTSSSSSSFSRTIQLDETEVDADNITASLANGLLTLRIPKLQKDPQTNRSIKIQ